jgi:hypothetical protein
MNDYDDLSTLCSRRTMIEAALGLVGVVALCGLATTRAAATAARNNPTLRYFTMGEAATIDVLVAQIMPTDGTRHDGRRGFAALWVGATRKASELIHCVCSRALATRETQWP